MKKLTLILTLTLGFLTASKAGNYKISEDQLNQAFSKSTEVTFEQMYASDLSALETNFSKAGGGEKTRVGFLVRSFFCGGIALHRYYMGTNKGAMWAMYCCIPVVGGVAGFVDFWWAVFESDAYKKYENNDKYLVWLD